MLHCKYTVDFATEAPQEFPASAGDLTRSINHIFEVFDTQILNLAL